VKPVVANTAKLQPKMMSGADRSDSSKSIEADDWFAGSDSDDETSK